MCRFVQVLCWFRFGAERLNIFCAESLFVQNIFEHSSSVIYCARTLLVPSSWIAHLLCNASSALMGRLSRREGAVVFCMQACIHILFAAANSLFSPILFNPL